MRFDREMAELDASLGPGKNLGALEGRMLPMPIDQIENRIAALRHHGPDRAIGLPAGWDAHPSAQGENRIEYETLGAGESVAAGDCRSRMDVIAQTKESLARGFEFELSRCDFLHQHELRGPDFRLVGRAPAARGKQSAKLRNIFRLDKHFGEGRVSIVGG